MFYSHTTEGSWHPNLQEDSVDYHQHQHHGHHEAESYPNHHEQRNSSQVNDAFYFFPFHFRVTVT